MLQAHLCHLTNIKQIRLTIMGAAEAQQCRPPIESNNPKAQSVKSRKDLTGTLFDSRSPFRCKRPSQIDPHRILIKRRGTENEKPKHNQTINSAKLSRAEPKYPIGSRVCQTAGASLPRINVTPTSTQPAHHSVFAPQTTKIYQKPTSGRLSTIQDNDAYSQSQAFLN